ncbi:MAG: hypothetical protein Q7T73_17975 [Beijerinckiaceae bacterium]|nr:hypothetical protein [Beijerinckiaceae bacterium]
MAVEVELARKTNRRLDEILDGYATALGIRGVVYVCGPRCHETVLRAVKRGDRGWIVSVTTLDEFGPGIDLPRPGRPGPSRAAKGPTWVERYLVPGHPDDLDQRFVIGSPQPGSSLFGKVFQEMAAFRCRRKPVVSRDSASTDRRLDLVHVAS